MNGIKKSVLTVAMTMIIGTLLAGSALASAWSENNSWVIANPNTLTGFMAAYTGVNSPTYKTFSGDLSGTYYVTPLGYEAADTDKFLNASGTTLFTNTSLPTQFGTVQKVDNIQNAGFYDSTLGNAFGINNRNNVTVLELTKDWTLKSGMVLSSGTLILGLNDNINNKCGTIGGDSDFDDLIVAASKTAPTPIPAAVWLLGSGLMGVMGFKRARKS